MLIMTSNIDRLALIAHNPSWIIHRDSSRYYVILDLFPPPTKLRNIKWTQRSATANQILAHWLEQLQVAKYVFANNFLCIATGRILNVSKVTLTFASNSPVCVISLGNPSRITPGASILAAICDSTIFITIFNGTISPALILSLISAASLFPLGLGGSAAALRSFPRLICVQPVSFAASEHSEALLLPGPPMTHRTGGQLALEGARAGIRGVEGRLGVPTEITRVPGRGGVGAFVGGTCVTDRGGCKNGSDVLNGRVQRWRELTLVCSSVVTLTGTVASLPWPSAGGLSWEPRILMTASLKSL